MYELYTEFQNKRQKSFKRSRRKKQNKNTPFAKKKIPPPVSVNKRLKNER